MKKALLLVLMTVTVAASAANYVFSKDGFHAGSSPRELPVQAVDLATGKVVVGLHARDDATIAACGWYKLIEVEKPQTYSNEYAAATGYRFSGTSCHQTYTIKWRPRTPRTFSKLELITVLKNLGKWDAAKAFIQASGFEDEWLAAQELAEDNEFFTLAVEAAIASELVTREEVSRILDQLSDGTSSLSSRRR